MRRDLGESAAFGKVLALVFRRGVGSWWFKEALVPAVVWVSLEQAVPHPLVDGLGGYAEFARQFLRGQQAFGAQSVVECCQIVLAADVDDALGVEFCSVSGEQSALVEYPRDVVFVMLLEQAVDLSDNFRAGLSA